MTTNKNGTVLRSTQLQTEQRHAGNLMPQCVIYVCVINIIQRGMPNLLHEQTMWNFILKLMCVPFGEKGGSIGRKIEIKTKNEKRQRRKRNKIDTHTCIYSKNRIEMWTRQKKIQFQFEMVLLQSSLVNGFKHEQWVGVSIHEITKWRREKIVFVYVSNALE